MHIQVEYRSIKQVFFEYLTTFNAKCQFFKPEYHNKHLQEILQISTLHGQ